MVNQSDIKFPRRQALFPSGCPWGESIAEYLIAVNFKIICDEIFRMSPDIMGENEILTGHFRFENYLFIDPEKELFFDFKNSCWGPVYHLIGDIVGLKPREAIIFILDFFARRGDEDAAEELTAFKKIHSSIKMAKEAF